MEIDKKALVIELRTQGYSVRQVAQRTGLSTPTVVALYKAYVQGGMEAVRARKPGRPQKPAMSRLEKNPEFAPLAGLLPENAGLDSSRPPLWTMPLLALWLSQRRHKPADVRAASRAWRQWGWEPRWRQLEQTGVWQGRVHGPLAGGAWLLCCRNAKKSVYWLCLDHQPIESDYLQWFERLLNLHPSGLNLELDIPEPRFIATMAKWLESHPHFCLQLPKQHVPEEIAVSPSIRPIAPDPNDPPCPPFAPLAAKQRLTHLQKLEAQSIEIMREVVATCRNPVMLYSIGKDSACMLHLALKAFAPARLPFPLLHVDTGWKFKDMYAFRKKMQQEHQFDLRIHQNAQGVAMGINPFTHGSAIHTDVMKTQALRQALDLNQFDAAFGGARRDEEKSRSKERIFSFRSSSHHWDPKNQRPELWNLYNAYTHPQESLRVFPLSNWTELDIWLYIHQEKIPVVPLYFAQLRPVVERQGTLIMVDDERMPLHPCEVPVMRQVRFRTLGCYPLTGAIESDAVTVPDIIREMLTSSSSERQGRLIDHDGAASMEKKKKEGYF